MAERLEGVQTHTHCNFIEIKSRRKIYLYEVYKKTDQLII